MKIKDLEALYHLPLMELIFQAHAVHRQNFNPSEVQCASLLSIKTGACPEDCKYCSQSGHYKTDIEKEKLLQLTEVIAGAEKAKAAGATRFCMGAAWRAIPKKAMPQLVEMIKAVKEMGLETCMTLGKVDPQDAAALKDAGLDFYNHNLDTSREFYPSVVSTRTYDDRLDTIQNVRQAGIKVCCGGILGLGENVIDRLKLIEELSMMEPMPQSVPINCLVPWQGTPLGEQESVNEIEYIRLIAVTRIAMPKTMIRLAAGRERMPLVMQALSYYVGANSIFLGEKLLTAKNSDVENDVNMFEILGLKASELAVSASSA